MNPVLIYKGTGEHITGVPAQDLSQDDLDRLVSGLVFSSTDEAIQLLTARGLYALPEKTKPKAKTEPNLGIEDSD